MLPPFSVHLCVGHVPGMCQAMRGIPRCIPIFQRCGKKYQTTVQDEYCKKGMEKIPSVEKKKRKLLVGEISKGVRKEMNLGSVGGVFRGTQSKECMHKVTESGLFLRDENTEHVKVSGFWFDILLEG